MRYPTVVDNLRRRRLIVLGVAGLLLIVAVTYAALVHRSRPAGTTDDGSANPIVSQPTAEPSPIATELPPLRQTSDPSVFSRAVADALFRWGTTTLVTRAHHVEQLVDVADPTGESTPGLVADLGNYLPTESAWAELAKYETRQWLSIESVTTPSKWSEAEAQAGDELLPGTTARTIRGTRHRAGVWEDEPVASEHDVAFTVFVVCGPTYPECHLLRLSMLDKPLE